MEEAFNTIYDPKTMEPHSLFSNEGKLLLKALVSSSMSGGSSEITTAEMGSQKPNYAEMSLEDLEKALTEKGGEKNDANEEEKEKIQSDIDNINNLIARLKAEEVEKEKARLKAEEETKEKARLKAEEAEVTEEQEKERLKNCLKAMGSKYTIQVLWGNKQFNIKSEEKDEKDKGEVEVEVEGEGKDKDPSLKETSGSVELKESREKRIERISEELKKNPESIFSERFKKIKHTYAWGGQTDKWPLRLYLKFENYEHENPSLEQIQDKIIIGFSSQDMKDALTQINSALEKDNKFNILDELKQFIEDNIFYLSYNDLDTLYPDST